MIALTCFMTELTYTDSSSSFIPDNASGYITYGYQIKSLTPHITFAYSETQNQDEREATR